MIRGTCPDCGGKRPLPDYLSETESRRALAAALAVPDSLARLVIPYLGLFAPPQRAMKPDRLARVLDDFAALVAVGTVTREREPRPAPTAAWKAGLETVLAQAERPGVLALPLDSHAYLAEVVWRQAGRTGAAQEARSRPMHPSQRPFTAPVQPASDPPAPPVRPDGGPRAVADHLAALKRAVAPLTDREV